MMMREILKCTASPPRDNAYPDKLDPGSTMVLHHIKQFAAGGCNYGDFRLVLIWIPAFAGMTRYPLLLAWIPAFAGMTRYTPLACMDSGLRGMTLKFRC